jgi:hypothetical protein
MSTQSGRQWKASEGYDNASDTEACKEETFGTRKEIRRPKSKGQYHYYYF